MVTASRGAGADARSVLKIATFNINGVNTRLANLVEWLAREEPDVVCLQELKATDKQFPAAALRDAGYHALWRGEPLWNGVAILARGVEPIEIRRVLPGQDKDPHARYLEAAVRGVIVAGLYLPNGNPIRGPKFRYKLAWFESLIAHAQALYDSGATGACSRKAGSTRCASTPATSASTRSGTTSAITGSATPGSASITCC